MATPAEHGFGPLFLTSGESGEESRRQKAREESRREKIGQEGGCEEACEKGRRKEGCQACREAGTGQTRGHGADQTN